jgi:predicted phage terminase large subunit-like protein
MRKRVLLTPQNSTPELAGLSSELRNLLTERQKRERAKNDLLTFASLINIPSGPIREEAKEEIEEFRPRRKLFGAHHLLWLDCLQQVEDGKIKRLLGLMPPGSAKSVYTSVVFPTHFMGRFRNTSIIVASYGSELPRKFGRRARSIIQQSIYTRIFDTQLSEDSRAADEWALTNSSEWMAAGILTGITGNRADGVIWDDLIKGREQADSEVVRSKTWEAYVDDLLTRKKPKAFEIGITCMVGDTRVLMSNGTHKNLRDVKCGDSVASYAEGKIITSKVLNWRNCGPDNVFTIKTRLGTSVTANSRHPFLVDRKGRTAWVRLKNLRVGDHVLRVIGENGKTLNVGLPNPSCGQQLNTYEIVRDEIVSIEAAGYEDVFDVQIEQTENFVANSFISHNTRWHEDDVAGRLLPENYNGESGYIQCRDGNEWYVVCLPAECEREDDILGRKIGEILWPEWFNKEMFAPFKRNPRTWSSLYQQRPAPESGVCFKASWLKTYEPDEQTGLPMGFEPGELNVYGASDYAVTEGRENYTVHIVVGLDAKSNIYVLDLWRKQATSDVWVEVFCDLVKRWKPFGWAEETGQIQHSVGPFLTKRMRERQAYVARVDIPSTKSKRMRAQSIIGRMAQNGLYCPFGAHWFSEFRRELLLFDAGKFDDQVDALSLIGQVLDKMIPGDKSSTDQKVEKVFSTHPGKCTVTLEDLFEANEQRRGRSGNLRIN